MLNFPASLTIGWHSVTESVNSLDETIRVYTPPLDQVGTARQVIGWAPTKEAEPEPDRVISDVDLFVPQGFEANSGDIAELPGGKFEVVGNPMEYGNGPFGTAPTQIKLRRGEH